MLAVAMLSLCAALVSASSVPVTDVDEIFKNVPTGAVGLSGASRPVGRTFSDHPSQEYKPACLQTVSECQGRWEDVSCCDSKGNMHMADISPLSPRAQGRCYFNTRKSDKVDFQKMVATLDTKAKFWGYEDITCYMGDGADECSSPLCDGMVLQTTGPLWLRLVASKQKPVTLPQSSDCPERGRKRVADDGKAAGGNVTSPTTQAGLEARVLKSLAKSRHSGSKAGAAGDGDMLWIGPVVISSLPMEVSSRDKRMKYEKGWVDKMSPLTEECLKQGYKPNCNHGPEGLGGCNCRSQDGTMEEPAGWIQVPAAAVRGAGVPVVESISNKLRFFESDVAY